MDAREDRSVKSQLIATDCPIESVVVFRDRAEICRSLKVKLSSGEQELVVRDLSKHVDPDSIRVEVKVPGFDDKNVKDNLGATITEVAFQKNTIDKIEKSEEIKQLEEKRRKLDDCLSLLEKKKYRLEQQRKYLNGAGDTVQAGLQKSEKPGHSFIQDLDAFLKFYDSCAAKLDENRFEVDKEIETKRRERTVVNEEITQQQAKKRDPVSRDISILLDVKESAEVEIHFSYVVGQASWSPKYDIRVFSNDKVMKLQYQGMICQNTGEDWQDAKISLSTAMPSVGGRPPAVGVMQLYFREGGTSYTNKFMNAVQKSYSPQNRASQKKSKLAPAVFANIANNDEPQLQFQQVMQQRRGSLEHEGVSLSSEEEESEEEYGDCSVTEVKESVTNATFEIPRQSTIPSDNTAHKVAIAFIDLQPTFKYQSGGHKAKHCFLTAKVKNTSAYALLAGPGNVFLDNNFISKTSLRGVSPSEVFECSLGVDPAVKVVYNAITKFREQSGTFTKMTTITYRRTIVVRNTRTVPVRVMVTDYLPQSTEDKIKVTLLEPAIKTTTAKTETVYLNSKKNIEWDLELAAGKSEELVVRYTVEYPAKQNLAVKLVE